MFRERLRRAAVLAVNDPISLQIFLDSMQEASGSLYLDDGLSFDYRNKNAFIFGKFSFAQRMLSYSFVKGTPNSNSAWLERVTIYGYQSKPNRVVVHSDPHVGTAKGSQLAFKYIPEEKALIIRKPSVAFGQNWQIKIL